jgi:hypothetical protein
MALNRPDEARQLVRETMADKPNFTVARFLFQERYRDPALRRLLQSRLEEAGMTP